ncbi:GGDEF domain-containing protein [Aliivibrio sp. S2MY1]|uniref:GGDEF domain-containing protein n=1 Tax=Aliivibrio sp. S2MY1 TaxID=3028423 RepID=UPI00237976D7|nr:GGDEF domain-containing protein [Aliivibrio sp. S2MY1]MDD9198075.1 GGDEF domain-containing protein [Aliivibrio sp. S2MY1]
MKNAVTKRYDKNRIKRAHEKKMLTSLMKKTIFITFIIISTLFFNLAINEIDKKKDVLIDSLMVSSQLISDIDILINNKRRFDILLIHGVMKERQIVNISISKHLLKLKIDQYYKYNGDCAILDKLNKRFESYNKTIETLSQKYDSGLYELSLARFHNLLSITMDLRDIHDKKISNFNKHFDNYILNTTILFYTLLCLLFSFGFLFSLKSKLIKRFKSKLIRDPLTNCYNRRKLNRLIFKKTTCIAIIDIDHFKKVNDTYGHLAGDDILIQFSELMFSSFRDEDLIIRYGGEEFVIIINDINFNYAIDAFERFRNIVEINEFNCCDNVIRITCSIGLVYEEKSININNSITKADLALYEAKRNGRNIIKLYNEQ